MNTSRLLLPANLIKLSYTELWLWDWTSFFLVHTHTHQIIGIVEKWMYKFVEPKFSGFRSLHRFFSLFASIRTRWHLMMVMSSTMTCHILLWLGHQFITKKYYFIFFFIIFHCWFERRIKKTSTNTIMMWWFVISSSVYVFLFRICVDGAKVCTAIITSELNFIKTEWVDFVYFYWLVSLSLCILFNQITIKIKITQLNNFRFSGKSKE